VTGALTMRVAAAPEATRDFISTPGHVMPIGVPDDGMLRRACGVDAALALTSRAGDPGGAAICAILDTDGEPSGGEATRRYAHEHSLELVSTVDVLDTHLSERVLVRPSETCCATCSTTARTARACGSGGRSSGWPAMVSRYSCPSRTHSPPGAAAIRALSCSPRSFGCTSRRPSSAISESIASERPERVPTRTRRPNRSS
jgi:hypothetical protein